MKIHKYKSPDLEITSISITAVTCGHHICYYKEGHLKTIEPTAVIYIIKFRQIHFRGYLYAFT